MHLCTRVRTYKNVGNAAATIFSAPSVGGLDIEAENATGVPRKTTDRSHLTTKWVNGESRRIFSAKNLVADFTVYPSVRILGLQYRKLCCLIFDPQRCLALVQFY